MQLKKGEHFTCECGETWEAPIEDYVVSGFVGSRSMADELCCGCDKPYTVEYIGNDTYDVEEGE